MHSKEGCTLQRTRTLWETFEVVGEGGVGTEGSTYTHKYVNSVSYPSRSVHRLRGSQGYRVTKS